MSARTVIPSALVFVPRRQPKPLHRESVKLTGYVVDCGCGTRWFMALEAENAEGVRRMISSVDEHCCPDCREKPQPSRMSRAEQIEDEVRLRFGATPQGGIGLGVVLPKEI
jgi:hypothetical protein